MPFGQALILLFVISLVSSLILTPIIRSISRRIGLVDRPDKTRKLHSKVTPVSGGIAVLISCFIAGIAAPFLNETLATAFEASHRFLTGLSIASVLICLLGVVDDFGYLRGRYKLIGQIAIVFVLYLYDVKAEQLSFFGNEQWHLPSFMAFVFTVGWMIGAVNSLNLLDGMDGLLSTIGIIICVAFACISYMNSQWTSMVIALMMAGALLGFLRYNFPPASIFLGDSGSMFIGLIVGVLAIQSSMKEIAAVSLAAPLALMTLPILDTTAAIVRRKLTGRSIYDVDRGHLHHCLQRAGLSNKRVLMWVTIICSFTAVGAFVSSLLKDGVAALACAGCVIVFLVAFRFFGYVEFQLLQKKLAASTSSFMGKTKEVSIQLQGTGPWGALWTRMTAWAQETGVSVIQLDLNAPSLHEGFHAEWNKGIDIFREREMWHISLPIMHGEAVMGRLSLDGLHQADFSKIWHQVPEFVEEAQELVKSIAERSTGPAHPASPSSAVKELALS